MADKYITKKELRVEPYSISHDSVDDAFLERLQNLSYDLINALIGKSYEKEGTVEEPVEKKTDGDDKDTIFLPSRLITLTSIRLYYSLTDYYEYGPEVFHVSPRGTYITWSQYAESPRVVLSYDGTFPKGKYNIGVRGVWGSPSYPERIKYLQGKIIQKIAVDKSFAAKFNSETIGDYSYTKADGVDSILGDEELDAIIRQEREPLLYGTF